MIQNHSNTQLDIVFKGPALEEGRMNVRDLAASMLGVGALFDAANHLLNGPDVKLDVNVRATHPGSFHIVYEVIQPVTSNVPLSELLATAEIIKNLLFGSSVGVTIGLFFLIKWLRGRKPSVEKINDEMFRLTVENQHYEVPLRLLRMYQDSQIRRAMTEMAKPIQEPGIERIEILEGQHLLQSASKEDVSAFILPIDDEPILDETSQRAFSIISLAFKEDNKWRLSDGKATFHVSMKDADFLKKVDNNEVAFAKGDILVCELRTIQWQVQDGVKTEYEVIKVVTHRPARQLPLIDFS